MNNILSSLAVPANDDVPEVPEKKERPRYAAGWYRDLSNEEYHGSMGYSSTTLKKLLEMPFAKMEYQRNNPDPPSDAMKLGTAVHTMVLEPEKIDSDIAILPHLDLRKPADREKKELFLLANQNKTVITEPQFEQATLMAKNVKEHQQVEMFLQDGLSEQSLFYWYNPEEWDQKDDYKIMCKVRPDHVGKSHPCIFDLKTARNASDSEFAKQVKKMNYHMSAAMYIDGVNRNKQFLEEMGHFLYNRFVWIVVESEPPYLVANYGLSPEVYEQGLELYHKAVRALAIYQRSEWKGYGVMTSSGVLPITRELQISSYGTKSV